MGTATADINSESEDEEEEREFVTLKEPDARTVQDIQDTTLSQKRAEERERRVRNQELSLPDYLKDPAKLVGCKVKHKCFSEQIASRISKSLDVLKGVLGTTDEELGVAKPSGYQHSANKTQNTHSLVEVLRDAEVYAGNFSDPLEECLIPLAILFSGGSISKFIDFADALQLQFFRQQHFFDIQRLNGPVDVTALVTIPALQAYEGDYRPDPGAVAGHRNWDIAVHGKGGPQKMPYLPNNLDIEKERENRARIESQKDAALAVVEKEKGLKLDAQKAKSYYRHKVEECGHVPMRSSLAGRRHVVRLFLPYILMNTLEFPPVGTTPSSNLYTFDSMDRAMYPEDLKVFMQQTEAVDSRQIVVGVAEFVRGKHSIINIVNKDELCYARAIVVGKAKIDNRSDWYNIRIRRKKTELAEALHEETGVAKGSCGLTELRQFQSILTGYQTVVVSLTKWKGSKTPNQAKARKDKALEDTQRSATATIMTSAIFQFEGDGKIPPAGDGMMAFAKKANEAKQSQEGVQHRKMKLQLKTKVKEKEEKKTSVMMSQRMGNETAKKTRAVMMTKRVKMNRIAVMKKNEFEDMIFSRSQTLRRGMRPVNTGTERTRGPISGRRHRNTHGACIIYRLSTCEDEDQRNEGMKHWKLKHMTNSLMVGPRTGGGKPGAKAEPKRKAGPRTGGGKPASWLQTRKMYGDLYSLTANLCELDRVLSVESMRQKYEEWFQEMPCSVDADDKEETSVQLTRYKLFLYLTGIRAYIPPVGRGETAVMYGRLSLAIHKDNTLGPRDGKGLMSRLLVEAKILARRQVAEAIISGDSDKGKTLTMSMTEVPSGHAEGILLAFSESCRELAEVLCSPGEDIAKKTAEIITSFTSTMSDRGATNPLFNRYLEEMRRELLLVAKNEWDTLGDDVEDDLCRMSNYFCKMHLLVNFATKANTTLKVFEDAVSEGSNPFAFSQQGESGAARLIRAACSAFTDHGNCVAQTLGNVFREICGHRYRETFGRLMSAHCYGCQVDHPSQRHYPCLFLHDDELREYGQRSLANMLFRKVYADFVGLTVYLCEQEQVPPLESMRQKYEEWRQDMQRSTDED
ncbi:hypothetical protein Bbelb_185900 [Branchiostoma belcheri]|nr:hypothetical protein Bbelb_185900 [Branchiostoma belcheri]